MHYPFQDIPMDDDRLRNIPTLKFGLRTVEQVGGIQIVRTQPGGEGRLSHEYVRKIDVHENTEETYCTD